MATDPEWKRKIGAAGWVLLIPIIGWPAILGYRTAAIEHLVSGQHPILPEWKGRLGTYTVKGLKAVLVINAWFAPVLIWVIVRLCQSPHADQVPWMMIAAFFLLIPIFSTLIVPTLVLFARFGLPEAAISMQEALFISAVFTLITFIIPAGFMNVSRTGRYISAFEIPWILGTISRNFRTYVEAWIGSSIVALIGHSCLPVSPWGIVWAYLAIVYFFNEIPLCDPNGNDVKYLSDSWFHKLQPTYWASVTCHSTRWTQVYSSTPGTDSPDIVRLSALRFGPILVPLPAQLRITDDQV